MSDNEEFTDKAVSISKEETVSRSDEYGNVLHVTKQEPFFRELLPSVIQLLNVPNIFEQIHEDIEYVVQVPLQHQKELKAGVLEMMHGEKSGQTWATLVRKLENGKQEIVCNCPIKEKLPAHEFPVNNLVNMCHNLYMQQMMRQISSQIEEVKQIANRIEQGQMNDRIADLISGEKDFSRALKSPDHDNYKNEIITARSKISSALEKIGLALKQKIEDFGPIPKSKLMRQIEEYKRWKTDYLDSKNKEFLSIQNIYSIYRYAIMLLAATYAIFDRTADAESVFDESIEFLKSINFNSIRTLDYIYPINSTNEYFYHCADRYIEAEKVICLREYRPYECIHISLSGKELKEAIENE